MYSISDKLFELSQFIRENADRIKIICILSNDINITLMFEDAHISLPSHISINDESVYMRINLSSFRFDDEDNRLVIYIK